MTLRWSRPTSPGDPDAFGELFARHRDRLWAVALRTTGNPEDAADALQDALISAFRRADSFRGDAAVTTWLHRIVVNACLDRLRRRKVRAADPLPDDLDGPRARGGRARQPATAGGRLGPGGHGRWPASGATGCSPRSTRCPRTRRPRWCWWTSRATPSQEAAAILEVPTGTVKSRCSRGRARLAVLLADLAGRPEPVPRPVRPISGDPRRRRRTRPRTEPPRRTSTPPGGEQDMNEHDPESTRDRPGARPRAGGARPCPARRPRSARARADPARGGRPARRDPGRAAWPSGARGRRSDEPDAEAANVVPLRRRWLPRAPLPLPPRSSWLGVGGRRRGQPRRLRRQRRLRDARPTAAASGTAAVARRLRPLGAHPPAPGAVQAATCRRRSDARRRLTSLRASSLAAARTSQRPARRRSTARRLTSARPGGPSPAGRASAARGCPGRRTPTAPRPARCCTTATWPCSSSTPEGGKRLVEAWTCSGDRRLDSQRPRRRPSSGGRLRIGQPQPLAVRLEP